MVLGIAVGLLSLVAGFVLISKASASFLPSRTQWGDWGKCEPVNECGTTKGIQSRSCSSAKWYEHDDNCKIGSQEKRSCRVNYVKCPEPTTVPEPTTTSEPTPVPDDPNAPGFPQPCNGCNNTPSAFMCPDSDVTVAPFNFFIKRKGTEAIAQWIPTAGNEVNLYYKIVGQKDWQFALRDVANSGYVVVDHLNPNLGYTFGLQQKMNCSGGQTVVAVAVDPPTTVWKMFRVSQYIWQ